MKYIDADRLKVLLSDLKENHKYYNGDFHDGVVFTVDEIEEIINSLQQEQQEVDLEKELDQWRHEHFAGKRDGHYSDEYLERSSQLDIACQFYELGKNSK